MRFSVLHIHISVLPEGRREIDAISIGHHNGAAVLRLSENLDNVELCSVLLPLRRANRTTKTMYCACAPHCKHAAGCHHGQVHVYASMDIACERSKQQRDLQQNIETSARNHQSVTLRTQVRKQYPSIAYVSIYGKHTSTSGVIRAADDPPFPLSLSLSFVSSTLAHAARDIHVSSYLFVV